MSSSETSDSGSRRAGILDLPMELILRILHDRDTNLFRVAKANRFLNTLVMNHCLPYLPEPGHIEELELTFSTHDVSVEINKNQNSSPIPSSQTCKICPSRLYRIISPHSPSERPRIPAGADTLAFISIAFDVKTIGRLTCLFKESSESPFTLDQLVIFTLMFNRLTRLIGRLEKVEDIALTFRLDEAGAVDSCLPSLVDILKSSLDEMMKACLMKASGRITAYGGCFPTTWLHDRSPKLVERIAKVFKSNSTLNDTLGKLYWNLIRHSTPSGITISASLVGNASYYATYMRYTTKQSDAPAFWRTLPPPRLSLRYSDWSYRYLSPASSITNLTIEAVVLTPEDWKGFLSRLHIPLQATLTFLKIQNCDSIPARSLVKFIHHLPRLTHLELFPPFSAFHYMDPYPISLPNLVSICASSDFLSLFAPKALSLTFGSGLPKLETMQIVPVCQFSHGHPFDTPSCQPKIAYILAAHPNTSRIILDLRFSKMVDLDIPLNVATTSTTVDFITYPPAPSSLPRPSTYSRIYEILLPASLFLIFFLTDSSSVELVTDLIDFLGLFQGLTVLTIVHDLATFDSQSRENSWMQVVDKRVLGLFKTRCRNLRTVTLEGVDGEVRVHEI